MSAVPPPSPSLAPGMACRLGAQQGGLFPPPSYASAKPGTRNTERLALRAFTLVEMLVAVALLAMISSLLFFSLDQVSRAAAGGLGKATMYQDLRTVTDQMGRELQQAIPLVAVTSVGVTNNIFVAGAYTTEQHLHFVATIDNNTGHEEVEVHYVYDGTNALWKALTYYGSAFWDFQTVQSSCDFNTGWDQTPTLSAPDQYAPVLLGVKALTFEFTSSTNSVLPYWKNEKYNLPAYVRVSLLVFDSSILRRWGSAHLVPDSLTNQARRTEFFVQLPRQNE